MASPPRSAGEPDIAELAELARAAGRFGLDTEFMSEGRYWPDLCLVQVAVEDPGAPDGARIEVIDALEELDVSPLAAVLADPAVEVVLHAGGQDVAILSRAWDTRARNVFDTQVAAAFAGLGAQTGYARLLGAVLGVRLEKSASFTRWDVRPLSSEQVEYAREDVEHLLELGAELEARLARAGRLEWAREECRGLEALTLGRDPETAYRRLPRSSGLRPRARALARELAAWRERTAQAENRPAGSVMADAPLLEAAKRRPRDLRALEEIRGVHPGIVRRRGRAILEAIERGLAAPPLPPEDQEGRGGSPEDLPLISLTEALIRARALEAGLAYELVATRAELAALVRARRRKEPEPEVRALEGWRRELAGAEVLELLDGRRSLFVDDGPRLGMDGR